MKRSFLSTLIFISFFVSAKAQKPPIDSSVFDKWPELDRPMITDDGKYSLYIVKSKTSQDTIKVVDNTGDWQESLVGSFHSMIFSADSRQLYFLNANDGLEVLFLGKTTIKHLLNNIRSFSLTSVGKKQNLVYLTNDADLFIGDLKEKTGKVFHDVHSYQLSDNGEVLLFNSANKKDTLNSESLTWLSLKTGGSKIIWQGNKFGSYVFDQSNHKLTFFSIDGIASDFHYSIYFYADSMQVAKCVVSDHSANLKQGLSIAGDRLILSKTGTKILFSLDSIISPMPVNHKAYSNVDIWSYKDIYTQPVQKESDFRSWTKTTYWGAVNVNSSSVTWLNKYGEEITIPATYEKYVLVSTTELPTSFYDEKYKPSYYLCSVDDGSRRDLVSKKLLNLFCISPDERHVIWFDSDSASYFSYTVSTGEKVNLSLMVPQPLYDEEADTNAQRGAIYGYVGWGFADESIFFYDKFDIWKIDLEGKAMSINITNGIGRRDSVVFAIADIKMAPGPLTINTKERFLLEGFNLANKYNGFWWSVGDTHKDPEKCNMEPYSYYINRSGQTGHVDLAHSVLPIKAKHSDTYLVQRQRADEHSNIFVTTDFSHYKQISFLNPEKKYNWLTAELVTWKMTDGRLSQGILYKPENFDSTKKYPVLFRYYEKRSGTLNEFPEPELECCEINIPLYVSNGYLVFVPDIYYKQGRNGESAVNAIVSAARYLSRFNWVDSNRMGLQGHSFGGGETNYLVTHSNIFAAACATAGISDEVSIYDQDGGFGDYQHLLSEVTLGGNPFGVGVTPWTNPDAYIRNSSVFYLNHVTTPLLLVHGDADKGVPFSQAVEMYFGLRRAQKKVWLLEYDHAGHGMDGDDARDYSMRMMQFFNYYLKGSPPPRWMTVGVPFNKKGIDAGLELDTSGNQP